jgi:hypothetical protein
VVAVFVISIGIQRALAFYAWTGTVGYGDSSIHTWWDGSEVNQSDLNMYASVVEDIMYNQYGPTDLTVLEVTYHLSGTSNYVDVQWLARDLQMPLAGSAICSIWTNQATRVCNHFHTEFDNNPVPGATTKKNIVCHEAGHTLGGDDHTYQPPSGCMGGGGQGIVNAHEQFHINSRY